MAMSDSLPTSTPDLLESPRSPQSEAEVDTPTDHATTAPSVFDQTTDNLLRLGSLTLDKFAQDPSEELDGFDIPLADAANPNPTAHYLSDTTATRANKDEEDIDEIPIVSPSDAVRFLRDATQREFGSTSYDPLKFEYIEELGQTAKSCILTISRPNGLSRSYRTKAEFIRKGEAKIAVASSAIKLGAVGFIKHGDTSRRNLVLAKLDAGMKKDEGDPDVKLKSDNDGQGGEDNEGTRAVAEIEKCCFEWRAGSVVPRWVYLVERKLPEAFGCALKVSLSPHIQRTYSVLVSSDYTRKSLAKGACAKLALEQGVIEFIRHGDGLKEPIVIPFVGAEAMPLVAAPTATTVQTFHDSLPKPMPDQMGTKTNGEINAVAWMNTVVQSAKGSRMTVAFHWYTDPKVGLHGCLLRLSRPDGPSQSYLIDAIFSKRADAKVAVCILACSQGVGDYIRSVAAEIEARVTAEMRRRCADQILPALGQALNKIKHRLRPEFEFECDIATFGCTLTVDLTSDAEPDTPIKRQWTVPLAYKSKMDAKVAVTCAAADDGLLTFIKYRGQPPPTPDDQGSESQVSNDLVDVEMEDGTAATDGGKKKKLKRAKKGNGNATGGVGESETKNSSKAGSTSVLETKPEASTRGKSGGVIGKKLQQHHLNGRGRGAGLGRPGGFTPNRHRGGISHSSLGPVRRPSGGHGSFPASHPNFNSFRRPSHPTYHSYGSGASSRYHPYPVMPPAGDMGFPGDAYPFEYGHHGYFLADPGPAHEGYVHRLGRPGVNTGTSSTHAPPPVPPPVMPAYYRYRGHDRSYNFARERELGQSLNAQPSASGAVPASDSFPAGVLRSRPYGIEYPAAAGDVHTFIPHPLARAYSQAMAADYPYENGEFGRRQLRGSFHAFEQGRHAPNHDRMPDRRTAREPRALRGSGSASSNPSLGTSSHLPSNSQAPSQPTQPKGDEIQSTRSVSPGEHESHLTDDQPPSDDDSGAASVSKQEETRKYGLEDHVLQVEQLRPQRLSSRPRLVQLQSDNPAGRPVEVETGKMTPEPGEVTKETESDDPILPISPQPPSPASGQTPSISTLPVHTGTNVDDSIPDETVTVPSKRGRSLVEEDNEPTSNKRPRGRSRSASLGSDRGRAENERVVSHIPPAERVMSVPTEQGPEKMACSEAVDTAEQDEKTVKGSQDKPVSSQKRNGKTKSYVTALLNHCAKNGLSSPEVCHEEISDQDDEKLFKVWIIMGKERLELPTTFSDLTAGKERVAKSVLGRLKVQSKKQKEI